MMRSKLKLALFCGAALLAGCGGKGADAPQAAFEQQDLIGAWMPATPNGDAYEFYAGPTDVPYNGLQSGRVYNAGMLKDFFSWEIQAGGTVKMKNYGSTCVQRPITLCAVTSTVTITAADGAAPSTEWQFAIDSNADGVVDQNVRANYARKDLDLSGLKEGEFFLHRGENFDTPFLGVVTGNKFTIRMRELGPPITLVGQIEAGKHKRMKLGGGDPVAYWAEFDEPGKQTKLRLPVKAWVENAEMMASANGGFILDYDLKQEVQRPNPVPAGMSDVFAAFEKTQKKARSLGMFSTFVKGPTIQPLDKYATYLPLDFNPEWVSAAAGNEMVFTSRTEGTIAHTDFHNGKYSESRHFRWVQKDDGIVTITFDNGLSGTMRFVRAFAGGYSVLFTLPHPVLGKEHRLHDMFIEAPSVVSENDLPGRYVLHSNDGVSHNEIVLHADKTASGVVGGYWFQDTNGDVVSFECIDTHGAQISSYAQCDAKFNTDFSTVSFAHIRRLGFMHREGNTFLVKYNANVFGARFSIVDRDYFTIAWTYRMTRIGNL